MGTSSLRVISEELTRGTDWAEIACAFREYTFLPSMVLNAPKSTANCTSFLKFDAASFIVLESASSVIFILINASPFPVNFRLDDELAVAVAEIASTPETICEIEFSMDKRLGVSVLISW